MVLKRAPQFTSLLAMHLSRINFIAAEVSATAALAMLASRLPAFRVAESSITSRGHRFVRRPDGRLLEYSVYGSATGTPVLYQPGFMSSAGFGKLLGGACSSHAFTFLLMVGVVPPYCSIRINSDIKNSNNNSRIQRCCCHCSFLWFLLTLLLQLLLLLLLL